jgi:hypothetical protein
VVALLFRSSLLYTPHLALPYTMNVIILLILLLGVPFIFFLVFLALSSCLGNDFRARVAGITFNPRHASYGNSYGRGLQGGAGTGGWEGIEMDELLRDDSEDEF